MEAPGTAHPAPAPPIGRVGHGALPVEIDQIREVAARINAEPSEADVRHNVAAVLAKEFGAERAAIVLADSGHRNPQVIAGFQLDAEFVAGWRELGLGFPLAGLAVLRNRVCTIGDVDSDQLLSMEQRAWLRENGVRASWAVPLPAKSGEPAGAIVLLHGAPHRPAADAVLLCQLYAQHAALALDNARLHDALLIQAIHDSKTGLFTHDYLLDSIQRELARAARVGSCTALLMMDIDDYKRFNDTYGHVAGDEVLAELAGIIREQVRNADTPARFGGEEFSVLLPATGKDDALAIAERIRAAVEAHRVEIKPGVRVGVTISVGVAVHAGASTNPDTVIEAADIALYDCKRGGKNAVRLATQRVSGG